MHIPFHSIACRRCGFVPAMHHQKSFFARDCTLLKRRAHACKRCAFPHVIAIDGSDCMEACFLSIHCGNRRCAFSLSNRMSAAWIASIAWIFMHSISRMTTIDWHA